MKQILILSFMIILMASCGGTKDAMTDVDNSTSNTTPPATKTLETKKSADAPKRRPPLDPEQIVAQLGLDEDQEKQFLDVWEGDAEKMKALRETYKEDRTGMREAMMKLREDKEAAFKTILTHEQHIQLQEILKKDRQNRKRGGKNGRRGRG